MDKNKIWALQLYIQITSNSSQVWLRQYIIVLFPNKTGPLNDTSWVRRSWRPEIRTIPSVSWLASSWHAGMQAYSGRITALSFAPPPSWSVPPICSYVSHSLCCCQMKLMAMQMQLDQRKKRRGAMHERHLERESAMMEKERASGCCPTGHGGWVGWDPKEHTSGPWTIVVGPWKWSMAQLIHSLCN